ncbi:MAG: response regulator [Vicinamibacterales bacterium]
MTFSVLKVLDANGYGRTSEVISAVEYATTNRAALGIDAVISVSDTGCGMNPAMQSQIFEPFYTTKSLERGTGLGLSMVYGIIRQSGGHISVDSTPGHGSTFRVHLPRAEQPVTSGSVAAVTAGPAGGAESVLLVDDDESVRSLGRRTLERYGYTVITTGSGDEAFQLAATRGAPFDLLVTDVMMPGMNGPALAEALRREHPNLKVLFISGYADETVSHPSGGDGTRFLQKPFATADLVDAVRELLVRTSRRS